MAFKIFSRINPLYVTCMLMCLYSHNATADYATAGIASAPSGFGAATDAASASVSGNSIGSLTTLSMAAANEFNQIVARRQNSLHHFSDGIGTSEAFFGKEGNTEIQEKAERIIDKIGKKFGFSTDDLGDMPQIWTSDVRHQGFVHSNDGYNSYNYDLSGFAGGADMHLGDSWNVGFAAGYSKASSNFEALSQTSTAVNSYQASFYASFERPIGSIDSNLSFNSFSNHSERTILGHEIADTAAATGKGNQVSWSLSAMGHAKVDGYTLVPVAGFTYTQLHRNAMNEDGAGTYDLTSQAVTHHSLKPMLGIDIARKFKYRSYTEITPEVYGIYRYETMDNTEDTTNHLQIADSYSTSSSTSLSRGSMLVGSSVSMKIGDNFTGKLQFDTDLQPTSQSYSGLFRVNYTW